MACWNWGASEEVHQGILEAEAYSVASFLQERINSPDIVIVYIVYVMRNDGKTRRSCSAVVRVMMMILVRTIPVYSISSQISIPCSTPGLAAAGMEWWGKCIHSWYIPWLLHIYVSVADSASTLTYIYIVPSQRGYGNHWLRDGCHPTTYDRANRIWQCLHPQHLAKTAQLPVKQT